MLHRAGVLAVCSILLSACTDAQWDRSLSHLDLSDNPPSSAEPLAQANRPPQSQISADEWCNASARHAAERVRDLGFDAATQKERAEQERAQCHRILAGS